MFTRRSALVSAAALGAALGAGGLTPARADPPTGFVRREGQRFTLDGQPYRFTGANMWYGAYLGADAAYGNRARLGRELDALKGLGVTNLRILGSSEDSPLRNSVTPTFRNKSATYNETLLVGLDHMLAEMGRRDMKGVIYLTNLWEWSGGMMTYLYWVNGGNYINANDPEHPWPAFANFNADFYRSAEAIGMYHDYVRAVVGRTNTITGIRYADDPAIMAWQLANEPRPAGGETEALAVLPEFYAWIGSTAKLIKSIDPHHLVSTGGEGLKGSVEKAEIVRQTQAPDEIDYVTAHIWPGNWGWLDLKDMAGTHENAKREVANYIAQHTEIAKGLDRPLVIEEFGYPRDGNLYDPSVATTMKDQFYGVIYDAVLADMRAGGPLQGSNFWAWNGEGRAQHADHRFQPGDLSYVGDPPHEPQGWYGVFDSDEGTKARIHANAEAIRAL